MRVVDPPPPHRSRSPPGLGGKNAAATIILHMLFVRFTKIGFRLIFRKYRKEFLHMKSEEPLINLNSCHVSYF